MEELNHWITVNVRTYLAHRGYRYRELEQVLGVDQATVSRLMNDKRRWSTYDLLRVAEFLDVPTDLLLSDPETLVRSRCFAANPQHAPPGMPGAHVDDDTRPALFWLAA